MKIKSQTANIKSQKWQAPLSEIFAHSTFDFCLLPFAF
jgi:hypothetical protein